MELQRVAEPVMATNIQHTIAPHTKDLGGFQVRRVLPHDDLQMVGPFIFFDHLGPATFAPDKGIDVRPHPHITADCYQSCHRREC